MKKHYTFISSLIAKPTAYLFLGLLFLIGSFSIPEVSAQTISVENADKFPAADAMTFSLIQTPWRRLKEDGVTYTPYNENHNKVKLKITNKGTSTLSLSKATLSNPSAWKVSWSRSFPISLSPGSSTEATIEFIARDQAGRVKVLHNKLTISSNDKSTPLKDVLLHGLWQKRGEGNYEPWAQEIIDSFGFKTDTGFGHDDGSIDGSTSVPDSDEILASTFLRADASKPVTVTQMAAYHSCCGTTETIRWYPKGSSTVNTVFTHNYLDGQSLLPRKAGSTTTFAQGTFSPSGAFGFRVGTANSDRTKNFENKIGLRIWKAIDASGSIIANAYIIANDYLGTQYTNYDYQDNIYYISNVKPESVQTTTELAATPSALDFASVSKGSSRTLSVSLKNIGRSGDPSIKISSVQVVGPNATEWTSSTPSTTTVAPQASATANVVFRPASRGIKNAALLVYHNAAGSPLRVPLYGIANESGSTIAVVKRVKGAADASVTIVNEAGSAKTWEADKNYRKGSIKLDSQVTPGPIAATNQDVLYQTYLSAASNLAETREEIPISNGSYYVRLHFAENYFPATGKRVFNISIEGQTRLSNFDIYKEVGYRSALVKDFTATVSDGVLTLKFNPSADRVALCGVEIFKASATSADVASNQIANVETKHSNEEKPNLQLKVSPNPNSGDKIWVEAANFAQQEEVTLTLHDLVGHTLEVKTVITDEYGTAATQMASNQRLNRGLYILKGRAASGETQAKLLVE